MSYNTTDNKLQRAVQLGVGGASGVTHITASTTLDPSQVNITTEVPAASTITITLPLINDAVKGRFFDIVCVKTNGGTNVTITDQGDGILGGMTAVLIAKGERIRIGCDGYSYYVSGGSRNVTDAGPMTATPGRKGEIVFNTSDSKAYVCTTASATAGTWSALN